MTNDDVADALDGPDNDGVLMHLKLLDESALPAALLADRPSITYHGVRIGGVVLSMSCPPGLAIHVLRSVADSIERDALAEIADRN